MNLSRSQMILMIGGVFLIAFLLTIMPLPEGLSNWRPQWVALTLIFWILTLPERVGVGVAWSIGVVLDVLTGTLLGEHALSFSLIAFAVLKLHKRLLLFPPHQQSFTVLLLLLLDRLLNLWVTGALGYPAPEMAYWIPPVVGALFWPWIYPLLALIGERFR